jgi:peptidyl-prolyl cis-trans isomerase C
LCKGIILKIFHIGNRRGYCVSAILVLALAACSDHARKTSQALASVNGAEITVLQLNEELQRAGAPALSTEAASKQLLEALIDRQLLQNEAVKDKLDRDPAVVQAVERAKALIVAQAYLKKRLGTLAKPSSREIEDYFSKHPEFFSHRKQFELRQLLVSSRDVNDALKAAMESSHSLDELAQWLDAHKIIYSRAQLAPTSSELAPELSNKMLTMPKGKLFIVQEGERTLLVSISDVKDVPVSLDIAAPAIEQFLMNQKNKESARAELTRLRALAKIEYLNPPDKAIESPAGLTAEAENAAHARGVAGLK